MEEISTIKKNIFYFIDYKGITKEEFYNKTGISSSNFKGVNRKSEIGGDKLIKILTVYPEINAEWLLTGKGEMLKQTGAINIKGDNTGVANTGTINGNITMGKNQKILNSSSVGYTSGRDTVINESTNYYGLHSQQHNNTKDINNLLDSYSIDKGEEVERLQKLYAAMLESKEIVIQELKEQIKELKEDKFFLKEVLKKNQM